MSIQFSAEDWQSHRDQVFAVVKGLLGELSPRETPVVTWLATTQFPNYERRKFVFQNRFGADVPGYLLMPNNIQAPAPLVLYLHYHGGRYALGKDEVFLPKSNGIAPADALTNAGFMVCVIDAYSFGERQHQGALGTKESGHQTELTLFKQFLWEGKTLWGMMLRDDLFTLDWVSTLPEVDNTRIITMGASLGGSRATWLSALDDRIAATIPIIQMTRYRDFAASGEYHYHGIYYYVPGVLVSGIDMEHIVALSAPRPQLILIGDSDPLSPFIGVEVIKDYASRVYADLGADINFEMKVYDGIGHRYTADMLHDAVEWLQQTFQ